MWFAVDRDTWERDAEGTKTARPVYSWRSQLYVEIEEHGK